MSRIPAFARGLLVGATLKHFLDPRAGRRRRAQFMDLVSHIANLKRRFAARAARDASSRARGAVERMRPHALVDTDDALIEARVRARLGHLVSHSSPLEVIVRDGQVVLAGPILESEAAHAIRKLRAVAGVRDVVDRLDRHSTADLPALQGGVAVARSERWQPATQVAAVAAGAGAVLWGLSVRRGVLGAIAALAGGTLAARGALNMPARRIARYVIGREGIQVRKTLTVRAPIARVFDLWSHIENLPRFMQHVRTIRIDEDDPMHSRWQVDGPAGVPVHFDAELTRIEQLREISWRTFANQPIEHDGTVRFTPIPEGTRISIEMTYRAPGGIAGHAIAHLLGWDPKARIDDDMNRMKTLLQAPALQ